MTSLEASVALCGPWVLGRLSRVSPWLPNSHADSDEHSVALTATVVPYHMQNASSFLQRCQTKSESKSMGLVTLQGFAV